MFRFVGPHRMLGVPNRKARKKVAIYKKEYEPPSLIDDLFGKKMEIDPDFEIGEKRRIETRRDVQPTRLTRTTFEGIA